MKKKCLLFILILACTMANAQRFPAFQKLEFGSNISTELYAGSSPMVADVLPDLEANIVYSWIEPIFVRDHSLLEASYFKFSVDYTQSPWFSRLGGHLGFKFTEMFEFSIGYTSLMYWNSNINLGKYENQIHQWNTTVVRKKIYENDNKDMLQTVDSKARIILDFEMFTVVAEVQHVLIDLNTSSDGYNYDYYYGIPIYKRDQLVLFNFDCGFSIPSTNFDIIAGNRVVSKGFREGIWERYNDEGMYKSSIKLGGIYHLGQKSNKSRFIFGVDYVTKHSEFLDENLKPQSNDVTGHDRYYFYLTYQKDFSFINELF